MKLFTRISSASSIDVNVIDKEDNVDVRVEVRLDDGYLKVRILSDTAQPMLTYLAHNRLNAKVYVGEDLP